VTKKFAFNYNNYSKSLCKFFGTPTAAGIYRRRGNFTNSSPLLVFLSEAKVTNKQNEIVFYFAKSFFKLFDQQHLNLGRVGD
jgi:hypothetical protein